MLPPPSSFCISFTDKVRLSAYRQLFLLPDLQPPSITQKSERKKKATGVGSLHFSLSKLPFSFNSETISVCPGQWHDSHRVQHEKEAFLHLRSMTGKKNSSLAIWKYSWIQNLSMYTSFGHFGTPHNTCSSLLPGSEWRRCCAALWWGVLLLLLHFLPLVWHSRSLNYVWTASNILYHQAPM